MSCCFLLYYYRQDYNDPLQTLQFYAQQRTSNEKVDFIVFIFHHMWICLVLSQKGVTIPSQRRYVEYFGHLLNSQVPYIPKQIVFTGLLITYERNQMLHSSKHYNRWFICLLLIIVIDCFSMYVPRSFLYGEISWSSYSISIIRYCAWTWFNGCTTRSSIELFCSTCST
jgi:NADH:ubiquinone oxidoreductase subunit 2 (subunit N)